MKKTILFSTVLLCAISSYSQNFSLLRDINRGLQERQPVSLTAFNGSLYFIERNTYLAGYPSDFGNEVWKSDGSESGTLQLGVFDGTIRDLLSGGDAVYFIVNRTAPNLELWKTNGTIESTQLLKSIAGIYRDRLVYVNGFVFSHATIMEERWNGSRH